MALTLATLIENGIPISLACAALGLIFALWLIKSLLSISSGTEKMQFIANAIEQGAKAYLSRQLVSISVIGIAIVALLFWKKDVPTAIGFIVGAVCSLAAGFIGMRIAVKANVRTAEGARTSAKKALQAAFSGGAVTGLLVVALALLSTGGFYLIVEKLMPGKAVASLIGLALGASLISAFV